MILKWSSIMIIESDNDVTSVAEKLRRFRRSERIAQRGGSISGAGRLLPKRLRNFLLLGYRSFVSSVLPLRSFDPRVRSTRTRRRTQSPSASSSPSLSPFVSLREKRVACRHLRTTWTPPNYIEKRKRRWRGPGQGARGGGGGGGGGSGFDVREMRWRCT